MGRLTGGGFDAGRMDLLSMRDPNLVVRRAIGQTEGGARATGCNPDDLPYPAALELAPDAVMILNEQADPVYTNMAFRALLGRRAGRPTEWLLPSSAGLWRDTILTALSGAGWEGVLDARDVEGREFPLWLKGIPLHRSAAMAPLFILFMRDHRDWHDSQAALREARDEAQHACQSKTRFLSHASHDLRQPLQALSMFATVLAGKVTEPDVSSIVSRIQDSVSALENLLNGLLDISKLDAGLVEVIVEPVSIGSILGRLETEFAPLAHEAGVSLRVRRSRTMVQTDGALLERILRHILNNAMRYAPAGKVLVGCRTRGDKVTIQVWDTGMGIPETEIENIFKEFHQLTNSNRDRRQGLGLGLAIVERMSRLLGHRLKVASRLGKGSVFSLELPLARIGSRVASQLSLGISRRGLTILVLDDDPDVLDGLAMLLQSWGHVVVSAGSAAELFVKADSLGHAPDMLITDYRLQNGTTGAQVISRVRSRLMARVPAILLTGDTAPERLRQAKASGNDLLHKPVHADDLAQAIENAMQRSALPAYAGRM